MRTKNTRKRQAILDVATQAFRELGYERTSMSEICARVGGSKATLYNHFVSKEELFFEVIFMANEIEFHATNACLDPKTEDVSAALLAFGEHFLRLLYAPEMLPIRRLVIAESGRSNLGRICYERGLKRIHDLLAAFLHSVMTRDVSGLTDPAVAAWHLLGLLEAELFPRCMLCVQEVTSEEEIRGCTQRAVGAFMTAYGRSLP
ncbi:MAG: TetR/AcrR family transcriptional regulator [Magnetococcales bacterium]|nr:TetR/AcrR family transcriptional regulator [Magnetococcales bacterium]MBF0322805.1 TetR/AcrR family transcriptional regulator [Magnetococcales bacterium]